jgi:predicted XRE-type DNA-binding protein
MKTKTKKKNATRVSESAGNVFADLGLPNPEQELMKARLTLQIYRIVKDRDLTQREIGEIIGIPQPHVSALLRNRPGKFSVGRLLDFLTALGQDVEIKVKATRKKQGEMSLVVA